MHRAMRRLIAGGGIVAAGLGGLAVPAGAEKEAFPVVCGGVEYTITSANGKWAVGKDTQSSTHFIPLAFTFTVRNSDGTVVFRESLRKKGHHNQEHITCTFSDTFTQNGQTFTFTGTAVVVKKP